MALKTKKYREVDPDISEARLKELVNEVDVIYTDTWVDMEFVNDKSYEKKKEEINIKMMPFQVNSKLLENSKCIVMHDMPIHTGYEITRDVVEKHIDTILLQAENRRHAQKSILVTLLEDDQIRNLFWKINNYM